MGDVSYPASDFVVTIDPQGLVGQGLVTEATAALIRFGFESRALKAFFVRETWFDLQAFAMLRSE